MAQRKYQILYKDGSKLFVDREERDDLDLRGLLKPDGYNRYRCTLEPITMHGFPELERLRRCMVAEEAVLRRFLEGRFTFEIGGRRHSERLETPEAMAKRLGLEQGRAA